MFDYSTTTTAIAHKLRLARMHCPCATKVPLKILFPTKSLAQSFAFSSTDLLLGPYQFEPLGEALFQAGYNVLVPLQPVMGWQEIGMVIIPLLYQKTLKLYQQFALDWVEKLNSWGNS
jgi:hypothetical protein